MIKIVETKQLPVIMHNYNLLVAVLFKKKEGRMAIKFVVHWNTKVGNQAEEHQKTYNTMSQALKAEKWLREQGAIWTEVATEVPATVAENEL